MNAVATRPAALIPDEVSDRSVSMSNVLARAAQALNLAEKRLVALALAGTDSISMRHATLAANAGWKMKITAMEYSETFGIDTTTAYEQLKAASDKLFERKAVCWERDRRGDLKEKRFRWVSSSTYAKGDGYVELNFSPEVAPFLLGLRKHFTTYKLKHAAGFDSIYAWRLFELLKSWQSTGLYTTTIEQFWDTMEVPPSCRKDFKALRIRVIEPATEAIRTKASMLVEWKPVRAGSRRVTGLEFRFQPDPQGRLDIEAVAEELGNLTGTEPDTSASDTDTPRPTNPV